MPKSSKDLWGHAVKYAETGAVVGYLLCKVHHPRRLARASATSVSGAFTSDQTELRQPLQRMNLLRLRFHRSRQLSKGSSEPWTKKLLRRLLALFELELTALRTLAVSETKEGRLLGIVGGESESELENRAGDRFQWARKCSLRREL